MIVDIHEKAINKESILLILGKGPYFVENSTYIVISNSLKLAYSIGGRLYLAGNFIVLKQDRINWKKEGF